MLSSSVAHSGTLIANASDPLKGIWHLTLKKEIIKNGIIVGVIIGKTYTWYDVSYKYEVLWEQPQGREGAWSVFRNT